MGYAIFSSYTTVSAEWFNVLCSMRKTTDQLNVHMYSKFCWPVNPWPHKHFVKNGFHWKASFYTSSNCYELLKMLNQTWHKCLLDHSLCNGILNLKFPVSLATRGHIKNAINHYLALIFSIKTDFNVLQLLNGWDRVKGFPRWLHVTLRST
jgi:hypothetical protein